MEESPNRAVAILMGICSIVPVLTVIDALVVEVGHHYRDRATKKLRTLERLLAEKKITL